MCSTASCWLETEITQARDHVFESLDHVYDVGVFGEERTLSDREGFQDVVARGST